MQIQYIGTDLGLKTLQDLLKNNACVSKGMENKDALIVEISSLENLYSLSSRSFDLPCFFYVTTPNKSVLSNIKEYNISGILTPPLQADSIISKIERAISTYNRNLGGQDFEILRIKIIAKAENIPSLPSIAQDIIKLTSDSQQGSISAITSKIKTDQGISSRVIKLVNSPFYGVRTEIASIDRAITLLGFSSIKNIALAISIDQYFKKPFHMYKTTGQVLWQHAYNTAIISQEIAKHTNQDEEALYMAGLLHDIGKVVLADFLVKEVDNINDEKQQLGCDHAEIAAVILKKWAVSSSIVEAVRTYHSNEPTTIGKIISTASSIDHNHDAVEEVFEKSMESFNIDNKTELIKSIKMIVRNQNNE